MRPTLRLLATVAVAILLASGRGSAVSAGDSVNILADAITFRESLGMSTDVAYLRRLDPTASSVSKYGIPLSAAEEQDLDRRVSMQDELADLVAWINANDSVVGGLWLDQTSTGGNGAIVVVGELPDQSWVETEVRNRLPKDTSVRFDPVAHSLRELTDTESQIWTDAKAYAAAGTPVSGTRVDVADNTVLLLTPNVTNSVQVQQDAAISYAPDPQFKAASCSPVDRCTLLPYRGGLLLQDNSSYGQFGCTAGFWTKKSGVYYILTAAHCWHSGSATVTYRDTLSHRLGVWTNDTIPGPGMVCNGVVCNANLEAAYIRVDAALVPSTGRNLIYRDAGNKSQTITGYRSYSQVVQGEFLCKAGITTNLSCGTVTGKGGYTAAAGEYPRYGQQVHVAQGIFSTMTINSGDSGGPLIDGGSGHTAYGFVSYFSDDAHSSGSKSYFGAISAALSDSGLTLCTTSTC